MRTLYVDTGAFLAYVLKRDRWHKPAVEYFRRARDDGDRLITSDAALSETFTRLRYDAGTGAVRRFRSAIESEVLAGRLTIRFGNAALHAAALDIMDAYSDIVLSYPDCVGVAVAREVRTDVVFGFDNDFRILGFELEP